MQTLVAIKDGLIVTTVDNWDLPDRAYLCDQIQADIIAQYGPGVTFVTVTDSSIQDREARNLQPGFIWNSVSQTGTESPELLAARLAAEDSFYKSKIIEAEIPATNANYVSPELLAFCTDNPVWTDSATGKKGPPALIQALVNAREIFNDVENPLYVSGHTPLIGTNGSVTNLNNIHGSLGWHQQDILKATYGQPFNLLIYYGWLNSFNSATNAWNNEKVAQDIAKYNLVVLGNGLQDPTHGDYANTQIVIPRIKLLNPSAKVFGYVSVNQTLANFQTKVDQWNTLQVDGILLDEAGYDYGTVATNGREAFNTKVDYVHGKTSAKLCFVNAWNMDHIIGTANDVSYPNSTWNASLVASHLTSDDWYLLESFPVNTTAYSGNNGYETKSDWATRGEKAKNHRYTYGINLAAVGIINNGNANGQSLFNFGFISSLMYSLSAFGTSDTSYGSGSAAVFYWTRPDVTELGRIWNLSPSIQVDIGDSDVYWRYADFGKFMLDFSTGAQLSSITKEYSEKDLHYTRKEGTSQYEAWYTSPTTGTALTTGAIVANRLYAIPFVVPKQIKIDRIAINVTTNSTGNARLGIYDDSGSLYPTRLIIDAGEITTSTTGVKSITLSNLVLMPGLKWLVVVGNGGPTLRSFAVASMLPVMGFASTLPTAANLGLYVSFTYAALPTTFPSTPTLITAVPIPAIFVRLTA